MAKPKTPPADQTASTDSIAKASSDATPSDKTKHTDQELYGDVKPTMVNGVYVGEAAKAKPEPTLAEEIAAAFTNERQIAVLTRLLATLAFVDVGATAGVGEAPCGIDVQIAKLQDEVATLVSANNAAVNRITDLEARLATMAADAPEAPNHLPGPSAS